MTNHVHLVVVPEHASSLSKTLAGVHLKYAQFINRTHGRSGHLWQNRFYSCPLEGEHELTAVRYAERNPVRARLVRLAWRYAWSSAAEHCGEPARRSISGKTDASLLEPNVWRARYTPTQWRRILHEPDDEAIAQRLKRSTFSGRPLGGHRFIAKLEARLNRRLRSPKMGRPAKPKKSKRGRRGPAGRTD